MEQNMLEASSRIELDGGVVITRCDQCRTMYSERDPPGEPPCETCWVETNSANIDALRIFSIVQGQFIMGIGGPVDINHLAIHAAMELYKIENRQKCFRKVLHLAHWRISNIIAKNT